MQLKIHLSITSLNNRRSKVLSSTNLIMGNYISRTSDIGDIIDIALIFDEEVDIDNTIKI